MKKKTTINSYTRIFSYIKPYKTKFIFSVLLALTLSAIAPIRPLLIQKTIQDYIQKGALSNIVSDKILNNTLIQGVIIITIIQIGIILIETIIRFIFTYISAWLGQSIVKDLRLQVFKTILNFKLKQFDITPVGTLSTRTINDIESINNIFSDGFVPIFSDLLSIIIVLISMFYVDIKLTLICLAPMPIILIATYFFKESVGKSYQTVRNTVGMLNAFVQEHLSGMLLIQTFNLQNKEYKKFKEINNQHKIANIKGILAYSIFFPIVEITAAISISFLIFSAIYTKIDAGMLVFYFLCLNQIFRPLRFIADKFNVIQMGMIATERVFVILDNKEKLINENSLLKNNHIINGKIEFRDVSFSYNTEEPKNILNKLNFTVNPGNKVALVGPTGGGKSTIIGLINRLYQYQEGKIFIDDNEITEFDIMELRKQIGVILQDVFLFSGSIKDNIKLNNNNISDEEMIEASKKLGLHNMILKLPNQYDFNVMERGTLLSTGQRQLISFTRMFIYNPKILIMDEATSSIDPETEFIIQNALDKLINNRTSIIVAHRLSTIKKADKIFFIKDGSIAESGNHEFLINKKGYYNNLYNSKIKD